MSTNSFVAAQLQATELSARELAAQEEASTRLRLRHLMDYEVCNLVPLTLRRPAGSAAAIQSSLVEDIGELVDHLLQLVHQQSAVGARGGTAGMARSIEALEAEVQLMADELRQRKLKADLAISRREVELSCGMSPSMRPQSHDVSPLPVATSLRSPVSARKGSFSRLSSQGTPTQMFANSSVGEARRNTSPALSRTRSPVSRRL